MQHFKHRRHDRYHRIMPPDDASEPTPTSKNTILSPNSLPTMDSWATGDGRRATGDGRRATGDGRRATGDGRRATGDGRRATGDGRRATGDGRRATGSAARRTV